MFIQTEQTPNPATLKFIPGEVVMEKGTANFTSRAASASSPLATRLFDIPGIVGVFFGYDFITLTSANDDWDSLKPQVLGAIMEHFTSGAPVIDDAPAVTDAQVAAEEETAEEDQEIVDQIKELLETRVRPAVARDGGDIIYRAFREGVVYLQMQGACAGCPSSTATLKYGIENLLKHYIPEVQAVENAEML